MGSSRREHIDVRHLFIRGLVNMKDIVVHGVKSYYVDVRHLFIRELVHQMDIVVHGVKAKLAIRLHSVYNNILLIHHLPHKSGDVHRCACYKKTPWDSPPRRCRLKEHA